MVPGETGNGVVLGRSQTQESLLYLLPQISPLNVYLTQFCCFHLWQQLGTLLTKELTP
jgi:hypothetical protein